MPTEQISLYGEMTSKYGAISASEAEGSEPARIPYYLNGFFDRNPNAKEDMRKVSFCKRPGTTCALDAGITALTGLGVGQRIQGMISSFDKTKLIFYVNNGGANKSYYFDGTTLSDRGVAPAAAGSWTLTGPVTFTLLDGISYGATNFYAVTDFNKCALINATGVWTEMTAATLTGLTKTTNICAMDGYLFIGDDRNRIYNCTLNTPGTWSALDFLTAADIPGKLMWLSRLRNYMIAFKQYSIEFFEDTGNPSPGSPLTPQKQLNRKIGLASKSSIKEVSDGIIFLGISEHGKLEIYKIFRDSLEIKPISSNYVEQFISGFTSIDGAYSVDPKITGINAGESQIINFRGKEFYEIKVRDSTTDRSFIYDNDIGAWVRWATCMTSANTLDNNFTPTQSTIFVKGGKLFNVMAQNFLSAGGVAPFFTTIGSENSIYADSVNNASSYNGFPLEWVSDVMDFGSRKRKFLDSLEILYDQWTHASVDIPGDSANTVTLYYRDSDFNTQGTDAKLVTRTIFTIGDTSQRMIYRRLGQFRKRNFALRQIDSIHLFPFRIWGIELKYNIGETDQDG